MLQPNAKEVGLRLTEAVVTVADDGDTVGLALRLVEVLRVDVAAVFFASETGDGPDRTGGLARHLGALLVCWMGLSAKAIAVKGAACAHTSCS